MPTIDLSPATGPDVSLLEGLPRRLTLTLPELLLAARAAGGAPLPFQLAGPAPSGGLSARLGDSRDADPTAYAAVLGDLHPAEESLRRRGLLIDGRVDTGILGSLGLLATPRLALDVDVAAGGLRARSWHRQSGEAVAALSTSDGIVFELAWFHATQWADELTRLPALPADAEGSTSLVPDRVSAPYELFDAVAEGVRTGRADLVPQLVARESGRVLGPDGTSLRDARAAEVLVAATREARGRLRILATDAGAEGRAPIGVVSWTLLADGWRAVRTRRDPAGDQVELVRVTAADLAVELAPVLAEVTR